MSFPRTLALSLAATLLLAAPARAGASTAFVLTTDFASGCLSRVDASTLAMSDCFNGVHADARARFWNGRLYVVNRFGADNVQIVDPASGATIRQFSVGNGTNPADVAWIGTHKIYVSRYASTSIWVGDPETGVSSGVISLAAFADADGIPEMDHMARVGPYVFVAIQRLDQQGGFVPADSSLVAVIDSRTDALVDCDPIAPGVQAIRLARTNPYTDFQFDRSRSRLLVGCVGRFGQTDGGIVAIDLAALSANQVVLDEAALGGDVNDLVWRNDARSYAVVADASFDTRLVSWSATAGVIDTVYAPGGFSVADAEIDDRDRLWVCDNGSSVPGLRLFAGATGAPIGSPVVPMLPPVSVVFDTEAAPIADAPGVSRPGVRLGPPTPNPARTRVELELGLAQTSNVRLEVVDLAGRRVVAVGPYLRPEGVWRWNWDLRDEARDAVRPGVYLIRATAGRETAVRRVIVTR